MQPTLTVREAPLPGAPHRLQPATVRLANPPRPMLPDLIARFDLQYRYRYVSPAVREAFGRLPDFFAGKTPEEAGMPAKAYREWKRRFKAVVETGEEQEAAFDQAGADGVQRWVARLAPEVGADGSVEGVVGVIRPDAAVQQPVLGSATEQRRFLERVVEAVPGMVYIADWPTGPSVYSNKQLYDVLGYSTEEFAVYGAELLSELLHPEDQPEAAEHRERLETASEGVPSAYEFRMRHKDGSWRWLHAQEVVFARHPDGRPAQIVGVAVDVTERKRTEEALNRRLAELRAVYSSAPVGLAFVDLDLRFVTVNEALSVMDGLPVESHLGRRLDEVLSPEVAEAIMPLYQQVLETGEPILNRELKGAFPLRSEEGHIVLASNYPVRDETGAMLGISTAVLDVTEERRAQEAWRESAERLRLAQEAAQIGTWTIDVKDPARHYWSPEIYDLTGFDPGWEPEYEPWLERVHPDDREHVNEVVQDAVFGSGGAFCVTYRFLLPDGGERWHESRGSVRRGPEGKSIAQGIVIDVTDRMQAEETLRARERELRRINATLEERVSGRTREYVRAIQELEVANKALESRNRELQEFAYVASHDLQEPLRKITTFATMLRTESGTAIGEQGTFYLDRMEHAATRMLTLIRDLLAFSRVQTGGEAFRRVDLNLVVREVLTDLEVAVQDSGAVVEVGKLPLVEADPLQMRQLFQNLVGNALKFRREGITPRIRVWGWMEEWLYDGATQPQPICFVQVEDNGIGFEERYLEKIFMPFQRLHGKGQYPGTGMGLAICRRIVERHGGEITARSESGKGSTFVLKLPVRHAEPEETPAEAGAASA